MLLMAPKGNNVEYDRSCCTLARQDFLFTALLDCHALGCLTLNPEPAGMTSLKNCLSFSALFALPWEGGKAVVRASCTACGLAALAATLCNRSAVKTNPL